MSLSLCTAQVKCLRSALGSVLEPETKALAYLSGTSVTKKKSFIAMIENNQTWFSSSVIIGQFDRELYARRLPYITSHRNNTCFSRLTCFTLRLLSMHDPAYNHSSIQVCKTFIGLVSCI